MEPAFIVVAVMLAMLAVYAVAHRVFPSWGTVIANVVAGVGCILEYLNMLPWTSVLDADRAAMVGFAITAANMLIRLNGPKSPVGGG